MTTAATIGTRIPSCGLMTAATVAQSAERSGRSFQSSRTASNRNTTPNESTWPQTTLSNQVIGLKTYSAAATSATRRAPPSSWAIFQSSQPTTRSAMIGGSLSRSRPVQSPFIAGTEWMPTAFSRLPTTPTSHRT